MIMARSSGTGELVSFYSCVINVRDVVVAHLISVSEQYVNTVVMFEEFAYSSCEGVSFCLVFINPVI